MSRRSCLVFLLAGLPLLQAWAQSPPAAPASRYEATVPLSANTEKGRADAFAEALRQVLVQVTGRASAPEEAALNAAVKDAGRYVQLYRPASAGMLFVGFDGRRIEALIGTAEPAQVRTVALAVSGVPTIEAYARVTAALEALSQVRRLDVAEFSGDTVTYRVSARGDEQQLVQAVAGMANLQPDAAAQGSIGWLRYRYRP